MAPESESLKGKLLIAAPTLVDPNFHRTVVLITEHTEDGAMGLVLNRPATSTVGEAVGELEWIAEADDPVFVGGPVAPTGVIVLAEFSEPDLAAALVEDDLGFVPAEPEDEEAFAAGVRRTRVFAGHAGWGPGQLEGEMEEEAWIVEAPLRSEIFADDPEGLWAAVLRRKGDRYALLATMPVDPSMN